MLGIIGAYIGILVTITLKNDIKRYQSAFLLVVSISFLAVYLHDVFSYLQQSQSLYYLISTFAGLFLGFIYSWNIHPKEGACIFSEEPYRRQQSIVNLAAVVPSIYIVLVFILVGLAKGDDIYFLSNLFLGLVLGVYGLYEFIKLDVGSTNLVILGDPSSGKSVLIASLYGFMCNSKYQYNYKNPVSKVSENLSKFLGATSLEEENPQTRYFLELREGRGWGKSTPTGNVILFGTKVKILPKLYKCIRIVLPDYPGEMTSKFVEILRNREIVKSIPKVKDIEKDEPTLKKFAEYLAETTGFHENTAKTLATVLTLVKNSDKIFYLIDSEELIIDLLEKGRLNLRDESLKNYFFERAIKYREKGRELDFGKELLDFFNLRHEIYSTFGKDPNLVLTKVDLIATISEYTDDQLFREFSSNFLGESDEFKASSYALKKILARVVGPRVNELEKNFAISGVISRIVREPKIDILPRGGESADEFVRIKTFVDLFER
ncbi:MAG: hypothetical protein QXS75_03865 [Thermoplasmatales archaeon]